MNIKFSQMTKCLSKLTEIIHQVARPHRRQVPNLHPEVVVGKLFNPFGSNDQPLIQESSNKVNSQKTNHAARAKVGD